MEGRRRHQLVLAEIAGISLIDRSQAVVNRLRQSTATVTVVIRLTVWRQVKHTADDLAAILSLTEMFAMYNSGPATK